MATITPKSSKEWRRWLEKNHARQTEVWLVYVKSAHGRSVTWSDAVDEAICFGWIDTTVQPIDDKHYQQRFTKRRPGSKWSHVNKEKVKRLIAQGRMAKAGLAEVELAKASGEWKLDRRTPKNAPMPPELEKALKRKARKVYQALAPGYSNLYRRYVGEAKQAQTREKRARLAVKLLAEGIKNPFGPNLER